MSKTGIAALLAVAAALMVGAGDVVQQRSAQQVTDKPVGTVALFRRLLRDRQWWTGSLVAAAGFGFQAAALGLGSVVRCSSAHGWHIAESHGGKGFGRFCSPSPSRWW